MKLQLIRDLKKIQRGHTVSIGEQQGYIKETNLKLGTIWDIY